MARKDAQQGFLLIEVLVALVILLVALMGTAGLVARSSQSEMESYQRIQALALLQDMATRINANRQIATCYSNGATGMSLGTDAAPPATCTQGTAAQQAMATVDLAAWNAALLGSAEVRTNASGAQAVGAMIGARGCIENVDVVNQIYRVTVAWQGFTKTVAPSLPCGQGQYGNDANRRAVSTQVRIGVLS
ncbi:hypothetical protein GCM10027081_33160 [Cupriavidus yeoncheonensis]